MENKGLTIIKNEEAEQSEFGMLDKIFEFGDVKIRVKLDEAGEPWFVANDVCKALGLVNPRDAVRKHVFEGDVDQKYTIDAIGRKQKTNYINEAGLYGLVFGSEKKRAKDFKNWVFSEILPAIRQRGMYLTKEKEQQFRALESVVRDLELKVRSLQNSKRKASKKRDPMLKVTTGTYKQFDIFEKKYCEFADQKQIRESEMSESEKLLWKVQHMSRSVSGMITSIMDACLQLGCEDEYTLRFLLQVSDKMNELKDTVTKSDLPPLLTEIRDGGSRKLLNFSQRLAAAPLR